MIDPQVKPILAAALCYVAHKISPVIHGRAFYIGTDADYHTCSDCLTIETVYGMARCELYNFIDLLSPYAARTLDGFDINCRYDEIESVIVYSMVDGSDVFEI
jgi:hypothetical protein